MATIEEIEAAIKKSREGIENIAKDALSFHIGWCRGYNVGMDRGIEMMKKIRKEHEEWKKEHDIS